MWSLETSCTSVERPDADAGTDGIEGMYSNLSISKMFSEGSV
jgi:hypothetical protein